MPMWQPTKGLRPHAAAMFAVTEAEAAEHRGHSPAADALGPALPAGVGVEISELNSSARPCTHDPQHLHDWLRRDRHVPKEGLIEDEDQG
jgi:hypothetical protein